MHAGAAVRPSAGVVTLALSPFVPAAALLGARFRAESSCLLPDPNGNLDPEAPSPANMGRRRSRAVLYQLSGHYKPDKMKTKLKLNNVSKVNFILYRGTYLVFRYSRRVLGWPHPLLPVWDGPSTRKLSFIKYAWDAEIILIKQLNFKSCNKIM